MEQTGICPPDGEKESQSNKTDHLNSQDLFSLIDASMLESVCRKEFY